MLDIAASFLTLVFLEIVLGIDNLVFISIVSGRLPKESQKPARQFGLGLALVTRLALLFTLFWLIHFTKPLLTIMGHVFSGRDILLLSGGLFLLYKGTAEIHQEVSPGVQNYGELKPGALISVIIQIAIMDIVFSIDSVVTAIGMTQHIEIMVAAIVVAIIVMIIASQWISDFIEAQPSIKMLALSFLLMVGVLLVADGSGYHVPRGYIYFSIFFSLFVETLNILTRQRQKS